MWEWVTGGDGYLARNEAVVSFGLGDASMIDQIVIRWPSGNEQMILDAASDQRILVVEGTAEPFSLFKAP